MKTIVYFVMRFMAALVTLVFVDVGAAEDFTLSDYALMNLLNQTNRYVSSKSSIVERRDRPGPGVEFDIHFPGIKSDEGSFDCVAREGDPNNPIFKANLKVFDAFALKFTLLAINNDPSAVHTGRLVVGAYINGSYRPEVVTLDKSTPQIDRENKLVSEPCTTISRTTNRSADLSNLGITMHFLAAPEGWDPDGTTITLLIEPAPGAVVIPEEPGEKLPKTSGKIIYVDAGASGSNNGSDWLNAFQKLQDAIAIVSAGEQIWVAKGVYKPQQNVQSKNKRTAAFMLKSGVAILGGFPSGGGTYNPSVNETILSGDLDGNDSVMKDPAMLLTDPARKDNVMHVVTASGADQTALLHGFTITGGNADGAEYDPEGRGGALYCKAGSPIVSSCIFKFNSARLGGAIGFWQCNSHIINCRFIENYSQDSGGAIHNSESSPVIINSLFVRNTAYDNGGAVFNSAGQVKFINCTIMNNCAYAGGGVYNQKSTPILTNCILWANTSRYGTGEPSQIYGVKVEARHCCIQGLTEMLGGINCISDNPQIADLETGDGHLAISSPCINAGDSKAVPDFISTDIEGSPRIGGSAVDMGVYE